MRTPIAVAVSAVLLTPLLAAPSVAVGTPGAPTRAAGFDAESERLSRGLAKAVRDAGFEHLVDYDNIVGGRAKPAQHLPNADVAVIELNRRGRVTGVANVLYDRDNRNGFQAAINRSSLQTKRVQFAQWNLERWDTQSLWNAGPGAAEVLVGPDQVDKQYMTAYPASVLKLMVAYSILRLVDRGGLTLKSKVTYHEVGGRSCAAAPSNPKGIDPPPAADGAKDSIDGWIDQMITVSDNFATCVLLQKLYDLGKLDAANKYFQRIGLSTFRMHPNEPDIGSGWLSGQMTMGALDTAKMLLIVSGAKGQLWQTRDGVRVRASQLSNSSKSYFRKRLLQQSFNEVLNPVTLCGSSDAVQGIPSTVSKRWIDPKTGHVVTYDGDLVIDFGYNVRPCVRQAQVRFAHKTGLTYNAGGDAGIVQALPGEGGRWYIVATLTSVGYRFGDRDWRKSDPNACEGSPYVCYSRGFGRIGNAIDRLLR